MTTSKKNVGGNGTDANESGKTDVMVKLKFQERAARMSACQDLFKGLDQGDIIACNIALYEGGRFQEDPFVTVYTAPRRTSEGEKANYQALLPNVDQTTHVSLLGYFRDGTYVYLSATGPLQDMVERPEILQNLRAGLGLIMNGPKETASMRVFFAAPIMDRAIAAGYDITSIGGSPTGRWIGLTPRGKPGLVIAEMFKGTDGMPEKVLAFRTNETGQRVALVLAGVETIHETPRILSTPNDPSWQQIAALPVGFDGTMVWVGRCKRIKGRIESRTAMLGLSGGKVVPVTINQIHGTLEFGQVTTATQIPAGMFRTGQWGRGMVLTQPSPEGTLVTVGYGAQVPAPFNQIIAVL